MAKAKAKRRPRLTPEQRAAILSERVLGGPKLAEKYGVSLQTVYKIFSKSKKGAAKRGRPKKGAKKVGRPKAAAVGRTIELTIDEAWEILTILKDKGELEAVRKLVGKI